MSAVLSPPSCPNSTIFKWDQVLLRLSVGLPLALLGVLGNLINLTIFLQPPMFKRKIGQFLLALSASDLLLSLFNLGFLQLPVLAEVAKSNAFLNIYPHIFQVSYPLALTFQTWTVYLTLAASAQRYAVAYHPTWTRQNNTHTNILIVIAATLICCCILNTPRWFLVVLRSCMWPEAVPGVAISMRQWSFRFEVAYNVIGYTLYMFLIPTVALIAINWLVYRAVNLQEQSHQFRVPLAATASIDSYMHTEQKTGQTLASLSKTHRIRASVSKRRARDRNLSRMMLTISFVFLVCHSVPFLLNIVDVTAQIGDPNLVLNEFILYRIAVEIGNMAILINSCSTIVIYLLFSSRYRQIFDHIFLRSEGSSLFTAANTAAEIDMLNNNSDTNSHNRMSKMSSASTRDLFDTSTVVAGPQTTVHDFTGETDKDKELALKEQARTKARQNVKNIAQL